MIQWWPRWIDAAPLDIACLIFAVATYFVQKWRKRLHWFERELYFDLLNGLAVPPIVVLMASTLSSALLELIKDGSRITLLLSGAAALFALYDPRRAGAG